MKNLHFVSYENGSGENFFAESLKALLAQKNKSWRWTIEEKLITGLGDSALRKKLVKDKRVSVVKGAGFTECLVDLDTWGVVFLRPGFQLVVDFISEVEKHKSDSNFDLLYSDVQLLDSENQYRGIWRRPHKCNEHLLHRNYVSGAVVVSREVIEKISLKDLTTLREIEYQSICEVLVNRGVIRHVFKPIVCAQRQLVSQDMLEPDALWLETAAKAANKMGQGFVIAQGPTKNWAIRRLPKERVSISIVIPTRGDKKRIWGIETDLIENVVTSLFCRTANNEFEVIVVHDVNSSYSEHEHSLARFGKRVRQVPYEKTFNFAEKCNIGALHSSAHVVVFLNDDIEVIDPWWLDHLVGYLESPEVGAVGPMLLLDSGMVQSAGHVNEPRAANYFSGRRIGVSSFPEPLDVPCEVSGLTAACIAMRREVFDEVGGFCEELPNNFNDVDLCSKIEHIGLALVWTPLARLYHFESTTRVNTVTDEENQFIENRWGRTFGPDLYRSRID